MSVDPSDQTIAERIAWIEQLLKYEPPRLVPYRRELEREYYALITDPEELPSEAAKWLRS